MLNLIEGHVCTNLSVLSVLMTKKRCLALTSLWLLKPHHPNSIVNAVSPKIVLHSLDVEMSKLISIIGSCSDSHLRTLIILGRQKSDENVCICTCFLYSEHIQCKICHRSSEDWLSHVTLLHTKPRSLCWVLLSESDLAYHRLFYLLPNISKMRIQKSCHKYK